MEASEFRQWRTNLEWTQEQTAKQLSVSRVTIQNWEAGRVPVPEQMKDVCSWQKRLWRQRDEYGPVTLVYANGSMWLDAYNQKFPPRIQLEAYKTNADAFSRVCERLGNPDFYDPFILDEDKNGIWDAVEVKAECKRRTSAK